MTTDSAPATIVVYGATGYTGGLVCEELLERGRDVVAAGRNLQKLQRLSAELAATHDASPTLREGDVEAPDSLDRVLEGVDVLINCAGPFTDVGPPVVRAALRNGVHYLDTTGEQGFIRWVKEECAERAEECGVVLMPACAFEYATGVMAGRAAMEAGATSIAVSYGVSGMRPSAGTQKSVLRALAERGVSYADGELVERNPGARVYALPRGRGEESAHGVWFPGGEPLFLPDLGELDRVESCLTVDGGTAWMLAACSNVLPTLATWGRPLADTLIQWWSHYNEPGGDAPFEVLAFDPEIPERLAVVRGTAPYPTTAEMTVETATRLTGLDDLEPGFRSVASLFDVHEFAESVGLELETFG